MFLKLKEFMLIEKKKIFIQAENKKKKIFGVFQNIKKKLFWVFPK